MKPLAMCITLAVTCLSGCGNGARVAILDSQYPRCVQNLLKIGLALHGHHDEVGSFPRAAIFDSQGRPGLSWRVAILPLLGERELYAKFKLDEPWDSPHNKPLLTEMPAVYSCPSAPRDKPGFTHYRSFTGPGAFLEPASSGEIRGGLHIAAFTDGMSNTLMVVEAKQSVPWTKPSELPFDPTRPSDPLFGAGSSHYGGFNVVFADASVWFLPSTIAPDVFRALITRAGNEVVSLDRSASFRGGRDEPRRPELERRPEDSEPVMRK
jgi:prepilin-type processing-associated H-X9-DG protein